MKKRMYLLSSLVVAIFAISIFYTQDIHAIAAKSKKKSYKTIDTTYCVNKHENCNQQDCFVTKQPNSTKQNNVKEQPVYCPNNHENCMLQDCLQSNNFTHHANANCPNGHNNCDANLCYNRNNQKNNHHSRRRGH